MTIDLSSYSFSNLTIYDLNPVAISHSCSTSVLSSWLIHDGTQRSEIPTLLQSCLEAKVNILFGKFFNHKLLSELIEQLDGFHRGKQGLVGFFTSGSSGKKKLVIHNIETLFESAISLLHKYPEIEGGTTYAAFPTSYMAGILNNFIVPLVAKSPIVLDKSFDYTTPFRFFQICEKFSVEWAWMSPNMITSIGSANKSRSELHSLRLILNATGPLSDIVRSKFASLLKLDILNTYGLSEVLFVSGEREMESQVSLGEPFIGVEVKILENNQIVIKTSTPPLSIYELKSDGRLESLISKKNSIFLTNDLAVKQNGKLKIMGRVDDIVVLRGVNVSLSEIELAAQNCNGVQASCARRIETRFGQDIELLIELDSKSSVTVLEIRKQLLNFVTADHMPGSITITRLPRLESGKIDRMSIRSSI